MTILILVVLPLSKNAFMAVEEGYIESVAVTAGVVQENVKILSVDEIFTRDFKATTLRMLLGTSVSVNTSVLLASGQQANIEDQSVLNGNLIENGLPSGTLTVQFTTPPGGLETAYSSSAAVTTPAPLAYGSESGSQIPVWAIVGAAVGFVVFIVCGFLVCRKQNLWQRSKLNSYMNASTVTQVPLRGVCSEQVDKALTP